MDNPRIKLYVIRDFGGKFNATFDFIKENWKVILKYITYFLLPLCLLQGMSLNVFFVKYMSMMGKLSSINQYGYTTSTLLTLVVSYGSLLIFMFIGSAIIQTLVYSLMKIYESRKERLVGLTWKELKPTFMHNLKRSFIVFGTMFLLLIIVYAGVVLLAFLSPFTVFFTLIGLMICSLPFAILPSMYLFEKISIINAIKKTFQLGFQSWGGILAICLVMGLLANVISGITSSPYFISLFINLFFVSSGAEMSSSASVLTSLVLYLFAIIQSIGMYISVVILLVALGYQYGHSAEKYESITVNSDIDAFESKKDSNDDDPEVDEINNFDSL